MANLQRFARRLAKAKEKRKYKQREREETQTIHTVASTRRQEAELHRKADIAERKTTAEEKRAIAEEKLAAQKASAMAALKHKRAAKRKRVMSEGALRREHLRPIFEAPKTFARSIRSISEALGRTQRDMSQGGTSQASGTSATKGTPDNPFPRLAEWLNSLDQKTKL